MGHGNDRAPRSAGKGCSHISEPLFLVTALTHHWLGSSFLSEIIIEGNYLGSFMAVHKAPTWLCATLTNTRILRKQMAEALTHLPPMAHCELSDTTFPGDLFHMKFSGCLHLDPTSFAIAVWVDILLRDIIHIEP
jgi:hypothetical protein